MGTTLSASIRKSELESFRKLSIMLFGNIQQRFLSPELTHAELESTDFGLCRVSWLEASPHVVSGMRVALRSYDPDAIKLIVQREGCSRIQQGGTVLDSAPGAAILYDPTNPYTVTNATSVQQIVVQVDRNAFSSRALRGLAQPRLCNAQMRGLPAVVDNLLAAAHRERAALDRTASGAVGAALGRLVSTLTEEMVNDVIPRSPVAVLRERIKLYIDKHLAGSVRPAEIARCMGCSTRYVYRAFEEDGTTPERYIWEQRLARARDDLASKPLSISEVAFACGFKSVSHFSRMFKHHFGMTPTSYQERVLSEVAHSFD